MNRKISAVFLLLIIFLSCTKRTAEPLTDIRFFMDTVVSIKVYTQESSITAAGNIIDSAFARIDTLEQTVSVHIQTSDVSRINRAAGKGKVKVAPLTYNMLNRAVSLSEMTDGAFDCTIGPLKKMWGFGTDSPAVPDKDILDSALTLVDYSAIQFSGSKTGLKHPGMSIDLGGIAKGEAINQAVGVLKQNGFAGGIVEAGGDLRIFGNHPQKEFWSIGIMHPRKTNKHAGVIKTGPVSIATSGDYERCFFSSGSRYHHLLNPFTGMPARGCVSVTILARDALLADAAATAVFVMGHTKGIEFIEKHPFLEGLIFYLENGSLKHSVSSGLQEKVTIMK